MRGSDDPARIERWTACAAAEPDTRRRAEYGGLALVFAEAAGREYIWKTAMEGWGMRDSQIALGWIQEGRDAEALEARRATLLEQAEARFGSVPPDLAARVRAEESVDRLRAWLRALVNAPTAEAFVAALDTSVSG